MDGKSQTKRGQGVVQWGLSVPFILMHFVPLGALWVDVSAMDWALCGVLYVVGMFFVTAGYHRYFSHRAFKTSRWMQFILAFGAQTSAQKGALWWSSHHRHHHRHSDQDDDVHSPRHGFWWSHVGWILSDRYMHTDYDAIKDMAKYPELRFLNRYHILPSVFLGSLCFLTGGWGALCIGFFLSRILLYHGTFLVNSLAHVIGRPRYDTGDDSKNSWIIAMLTLGEGWHNNHHHYQSSTTQGFYWWEIDMTYAALKVMAWMGLVWDLRRPSDRFRATNWLNGPETEVPTLLSDLPSLPSLPSLPELPAFPELPDMADLQELSSPPTPSVQSGR